MRQIARDTIAGNAEAAVCFEKYGYTFVGMTQIEDAEIAGVRNSVAESKLQATKGEILEEYLARHYADENREPKKSVLILAEPQQDTALADFLKQNRISVEYPSI